MADLLMKMPVPYEPKKKNRWLLRFPADLGIQEWWLASASRPSITQNEVEIPFLNTSTWVAGRFLWEPMELTLRDPIGPSASQAMMEWVRLHHESVTGRDGYSDFYKKDITLDILGPVGDIVSEWIIKGAFIKNFAQGDFSWDNESVAQNLTLTLGMDYCILNF
jgi:hypothetical protein